jgi:hypothetical protein
MVLHNLVELTPAVGVANNAGIVGGGRGSAIGISPENLINIFADLFARNLIFQKKKKEKSIKSLLVSVTSLLHHL